MGQAAFNESGQAYGALKTMTQAHEMEETAYVTYLREQGVHCSLVNPYLISGSPADFGNWLVHISMVRQQFTGHIRPILEFLTSEELSFAIPADAVQHSNILGGTCGFHLTAKVISISVRSASDLQGIVNKLCNLTRDVIGPAMPCAFHLTDIIAVSYGSLFDNIDSAGIRRSIFYGSALADPLLTILKSRGEQWPLHNIRKLKPYKEGRLLGKQYIPIGFFKKETKGNVIKALKINSIYNMQWCVLKQGRRYQSFDNCGRDATDRLKWQYHVHQRFERKGILPKPIACFELNGDTFFSMEYKESVSLTEKAAELSEGHVWRFIPVERKRTMVGYLLQVVKILGIFHEEGIVHRDVTASNFIVTETGQVFAIDIELCYDLQNKGSIVPFTLGTPGYMSPTQAACSGPSVADDIYSFGALLISVLSGVLPNRLNHRDLASLEENLAWFIGSPALISVIISCLGEDPASRPSLSEIRQVLEMSDTVLIATPNIPADHPPAIPLKTAETILAEVFRTAPALLTTPGKAEIATLVLFIRYFPDGQKTLVIHCIDSLLGNSEIIEMPGHDLQVIAAELSMLTDSAARLLHLMGRVVPKDNDPITGNLSVYNGLSGRGLTLLHLTGQTLFQVNPNELLVIVNRIMACQESDNSWMTMPNTTNGKGHKVTGFSHGVSGIIYFLLSYYARYGTKDLRDRIINALNWLSRQRKPENGRLVWTVSLENKTVDPWLEHGFSGVALTFIKAYEVLGNREYQQIASEVLSYHPLYITSNNCSFGNGLAGLGEVYLEAFRVFGDPIWLERANAIQGTLLNSCYRENGQCYWLAGTQLNPTAGFWSGNTGIMHFLLRVKRPHEIPFPIHLIS